jgi:hypothetical protein
VKKVLQVSLVVALLGLLSGLAIPVFAHGPDDGETAPVGQESWEAMHEACEEGDWETMAENAEEVHDECSGYASYDGEVRAPHAGWSGMGGRMGG